MKKKGTMMEKINYMNVRQLCFSVKEACEVTGIGATKMYQALDSGQIKAVKWGKRTLILRADLESFLNNLDAYKADKEVQNG